MGYGDLGNGRSNRHHPFLPEISIAGYKFERVHSSVVRAADCRSAGPWFKSGCALISRACIKYAVFSNWGGSQYQQVSFLPSPSSSVVAIHLFIFPGTQSTPPILLETRLHISFQNGFGGGTVEWALRRAMEGYWSSPKICPATKKLKGLKPEACLK